MSPWIFLAAALVFLLAAAALLFVSARRRKESGLPPGRILYADHAPQRQPEKPFFDAELRLTGKPDYLVEAGDTLIPVEVKSGWAPAEPHAGHVYQLMAYCLLVQRAGHARPPYGILRYRNRSFAIDYTREAERDLLRLIDEIHAAGKKEQPRSHDEPGRCARCGYRSVCDDRL